jgi:hypothetical protein
VQHFDEIEQVTDEMRGLIASQWPHLLAKLRPPKSRGWPAAALSRVRAAPHDVTLRDRWAR